MNQTERDEILGEWVDRLLATPEEHHARRAMHRDARGRGPENAALPEKWCATGLLAQVGIDRGVEGLAWVGSYGVSTRSVGQFVLDVIGVYATIDIQADNDERRLTFREIAARWKAGKYPTLLEYPTRRDPHTPTGG